MRQIFTSSGAFPVRGLKEILAVAEDWGLSNIELSSDIAYNPDNLAIAKHAAGRFSFLLHNYFPAPSDPFVLNLASTDPVGRARSLDHCRKALEFSSELLAPLFAAHAGFAANLRPEHLGNVIGESDAVPREYAYSIFLDCVGELIRYGKRLGVRFLVENNVVTKKNLVRGSNAFLLLADSEEILRCARDVGSGFGMLIDTGHLKVSSESMNFDPLLAMQEVSDCTYAYHLSDNDGVYDSNKEFARGVWFLDHMKNDLPVTIEVYNSSEASIAAMSRALCEVA